MNLLLPVPLWLDRDPIMWLLQSAILSWRTSLEETALVGCSNPLYYRLMCITACNVLCESWATHGCSSKYCILLRMVCVTHEYEQGVFQGCSEQIENLWDFHVSLLVGGSGMRIVWCVLTTTTTTTETFPARFPRKAATIIHHCATPPKEISGSMELHPFLAICVMAVILIAFSFSDNIFVHYSRRRGVMSPTMAHRDVICWLEEAYAESHWRVHNLQAKREFYATLIYFNIYGFIIIHRHKIGGKQEGRFVNGGDMAEGERFYIMMRFCGMLN